MATVNLTTVAGRDKLQPRREPYYVSLMQGCALGFRKMSSDSAGAWVARFTSSETRKAHKRALGAFDHLVPSDRFGAAKMAAETWFKHLGAGGAVQVVTVKMACENYVKHVRDRKSKAKGDEIEARFQRWVYADKMLACIELPRLTRASLEAWRKRLAGTPVVVNPHSADKVTRPRALSTLNRDMTALRAALNFALDYGHATNDLAWRVALRPARGEGANGRRTLYLDRDQRRELLRHTSEELSGFLTGMTLLPLRPGALAALTVSHFNKRLGVLTVGKDKAGNDRSLPLPKHLVAIFTEASRDKLPNAPLLSRANGKHWAKDNWKKSIKEASLAAKLPEETTAYTLRHSVITDLVTREGLDLLTVAQLSGTSVAMIEKHYGHLQADRAVAALAGLVL
jgi:integrase